MARHSAKAMLWKTMDFGVETNFSRPASVLWGSVKEMDRLVGEARSLKVQNEGQFGAMREGNVYGLFFGSILGTAFDRAREHSGVLAALTDMAAGYIGAGVDSAISMLIKKMPVAIDKLEDVALTFGTIGPWIRKESDEGGASGFFWELVEFLLLPPEMPVGENTEKGHAKIEEMEKYWVPKPLDEGVASEGGGKTLYDEMTVVMQIEGWEHLNTAQTAKNETPEWTAAKELAEANMRIAKGLENYQKGWSTALARMYYQAYHNSSGMRQAYAGRAHKNR